LHYYAFTLGHTKATNQLSIIWGPNEVTHTLPTNVILKDTETLSNGNFIVGCEYNGSVNVAGKTFSSSGRKNALFLTISPTSGLIDAIGINNHREETVIGIATNGDDEVAYHGRYIERYPDFSDPQKMIVDSCFFVNIVSVSISCDSAQVDSALDTTSCTLLSLDYAEKKHFPVVRYELQKYIDNGWIVTPIIENEYGIFAESNGLYRLVRVQDNCPPIASDSTLVVCVVQNECPILNSVTRGTPYTCSTFNLSSTAAMDVRFVFGYHQYDFNIDSSEIVTYDTLNRTIVVGENLIDYCLNQNIDGYLYTVSYKIECPTCGECNLEEFGWYYWAKPNENTQNAEFLLEDDITLRSKGNSLINFYPNPFTKSTNIDAFAMAEGNMNLKVYSATGKVIADENYMLRKGKNNRSLDFFQSMSNGVYVVKVKLDGKTYIRRIIKLD